MKTKRTSRSSVRSTKKTAKKSTSFKDIFSTRRGLIFIVIFAVMGAGFLLRSFASSEQPTYKVTVEKGAHAPGELLLRFRAGVPQDVQDKLLNRFQAKEKGSIPQIGVRHISVPAEALDAVENALAKNPTIEFVEKNYVVAIAETTANDPGWSVQWGLKGEVVADGRTTTGTYTSRAWDTTTGSNAVTIAIVDTGVASVTDVGTKLLPGYDFVNNDASTEDTHGHGTRAASITAAETNNANLIAGYCWSCRVLPVKVMSGSTGVMSTLLQGITYAADKGAQVINISLSTSSSSIALDNAVNYARNKNSVIVAAAGNDSSDIPRYPAAHPQVIGVGAGGSDPSNNFMSFSNYGNWVSLSAPGSNYSVGNDGRAALFNGTSSASPVVSGIAGLLYAARPTATVSEIEQALLQTAEPLPPQPGGKNVRYGRINAYRALLALTGGGDTLPPPPPADITAPVVSVSSPANGATVTSEIGVAVNATDNTAVARVELYRNGVLVGTDSTAPYSFYWDTRTLTNGTYSLQARAYDAAGNTGITSTVNVLVNNAAGDTTAPNVFISSPVDGARVTKQVRINATSNDGVGVTRMEAYVDGKLVGSSTTSSLSVQWNAGAKSVSRGTHTIEIRAYDAAGNVGTRNVGVVK